MGDETSGGKVPETDEEVAKKVANIVKSEGILDILRERAANDLPEMDGYDKLKTTVDSAVTKYLSELSWNRNMNRVKERETLMKFVRGLPSLKDRLEMFAKSNVALAKDQLSEICEQIASAYLMEEEDHQE